MKTHPFFLAYNGRESRSEPASPNLYCEAGAPLGTTRVDDGAAALGLHAHQETMSAGAANLGRLVSTFHREPLSNNLKLKRA